MATPVRPNEVPKDLMCSICISVPLEPVMVSSCYHVYCRDCVRESLHRQECNDQPESCPVCRCDCTTDDLLPLEEESPLTYRIWSNIVVKCDHHGDGCNWTGSILDYKTHKYICPKTTDKKLQEEKELIRTLRIENEKLKLKNKLLHIRNQELEEKARKRNSSSYSKKLEELKAIVRRNIELPVKNGKGGYAYNRFSVVPLTRLICQNLEDIPSSINPNKIFECVKKIGLDLRRDHHDNPEHFYIDVRMLVCVCLASAWFTEKQLGRIRDIAVEHGWAEVLPAMR